MARVFWGEGLFLRPQHFQQQDRYHEARLHATVQALASQGWGVLSMVVDEAALDDGVLRIESLHALFREGEPVRAPHADTLPPPQRLDSLPALAQSILFYAALPHLRTQGGNCGEGDARFRLHEREASDLYSEAAPARLSVLGNGLQVLSELQSLEGYECLPLLRLKRQASGAWQLDQEFVPPSLTVGASPRLKALHDSLLAKLLAKVHALQAHQRDPGRSVVDLRDGDAASFWLLHTCSAAWAAMSQLANMHPCRLYEQMLVLAGGLMTYARHHKLEDLPDYEHANPGPCFSALEAIVRELLDTVISARYIAIPLALDRPHYYSASLDSGKIVDGTTLYLAASSDLSLKELTELAPLRFKLGAPDAVEKLVLSALPGVRLVHVAQVPSAIPVRPGACYFALDRKSTLYDAMLKTQAMAVYVPSGIHGLELELFGVAP